MFQMTADEILAAIHSFKKGDTIAVRIAGSSHYATVVFFVSNGGPDVLISSIRPDIPGIENINWIRDLEKREGSVVGAISIGNILEIGKFHSRNPVLTLAMPEQARRVDVRLTAESYN